MVILYWVLLAVMLVGIIGAVLPGIPGPTIILAAIVIWGLGIQNFAAIAWPLGVAILVLVFGLGIDLLASQWGAKKAGASNWGQWGAIIGMMIGFLGLLPALPIGGPILGLLLGPLLGAIGGEFLYTKDLQKSVKAGVGIVVGSVVGNLVQGVIAITPVVVFIVTTWPPLSPPQ
ncbi:DUF456 family protein [filamentous cyanobacterium LEGE 11480]|uniref:DUF456 family protein n=1 Tax=Romeriopsis navalis LEGE 11480 TaxID=2777977 RepID=A0A928VIX3_9CYAN|nr:DUF456 family protein [Romeriopsis navalis]MBE9029458.1 DUF456 family protein [Romeriopsis navalis LEGE 11480]